MKINIYHRSSHEDVNPYGERYLGGEPYLNEFIISPWVDEEVIDQVCVRVFRSKPGPAEGIRGAVINEIWDMFE